MDHGLHVFGNSGGPTNRPVKCDDHKLLSYLLQRQNSAFFKIYGEVPVTKLQLKITSSSFFVRGRSDLKKEGRMSSGSGTPFDLICHIARSNSDSWNGW